MKNLFILILIVFLSVSCKQGKKGVYCKINGFTQGTTYNITYHASDTLDFQPEIDSILRDFDMSLSSYIDNSIISRINKNDTDVITDNYFNTVYRKSFEIFKESNGLFDLTVMPLVNVWGFGPGKKETISKSLIDSLLQFIGMNKIQLSDNKIIKSDPRVQLDVNAIAQGYSVDVVGGYFDSLGIKDYMVEIGGEVKVKGKNPNGQLWRVGIDRPEYGNMIPGDQLQAIIRLTDRALATSGNYRKFYEENGIKYAHTINPKTGYPAKDSLLSATILANDCMSADAYATVCMVSGFEKSKELLKNHKDLDGYLIYGDDTGSYKIYYTDGMKSLIAK